MEQVAGIEPAFSAWQAEVLTSIRYLHMEHHAGIEPAPSAWKADILADIRMVHLYEVGITK